MPNSQETRDAVTGTSPQVAEYIVRQFSESMPHIVWFADGTGAVTYCNQHGLTYFGIDLEDMTAWRWDKLLHPDDLPPVLMAWEAARLGQTRYTVYYRLRRYDGVFRWFLCSAEPQKDTSGNVLRWCGNSVDIEDGKATEEKARLAEHEMRLALDTTPLTLLRMDAAGKYTMVAGPALKNLGLDGKTMLGLRATEVFGKEHPIAALFELARLDGGDVQGEAAYNERHLDIRLQPILSRDNRLEGVTGVMVDITERRVHERLVASEKAAQEASELKAQFLANMSHEVRTPLGGVLG
ncbi:MAG: hybrid sensor histidine kinase/response regulator, partial [Deltaproteobacteria bacterium]